MAEHPETRPGEVHYEATVGMPNGRVFPGCPGFGMFAVVTDGVDVHLIRSRRPFVGLDPLPGFLQNVPSTDFIVEKREPPFGLLLGHSV
jgi:hypothetical protein